MTEMIRTSHESLKAIPYDNMRIMHSMYEDNDLDGAEKVESLIDFLEQEAPETFVGILANDSVTPQCVHDDKDYEHYHCDFYAPFWYTVLVSKKIWDEYEDRVKVADQAWKDAHQCKAK